MKITKVGPVSRNILPKSAADLERLDTRQGIKPIFKLFFEGRYLRKGGTGGSREGHTGSLGKQTVHPESFIPIIKFFQLNEGRCAAKWLGFV